MRGGLDVEMSITALVSQVAEVVQNILKPEQFHVLILTGEYGRGEGGVERIGTKEYPDGNLDFMVLTTPAVERERDNLKCDLDENLLQLSTCYNTGLDVTFISVAKLLRSPCRVMEYGMRFGHKTILGDDRFIPSIHRFSVERIVPKDVLNVLVNRGTLLVINERILQKGDLPEAERKQFVKRMMKCAIGYGDALLFFLGDYHWSSAEKQRRMRNRTDVDVSFRRLYDEAVEFRFQSDYSVFLDRDFNRWIGELREQVAPIHLQCESLRLAQPALTWKSYPEMAFRHTLREENYSLCAVAKKMANFFHWRSYPGRASWPARLGYRCSGMRGLLPLLFPPIAYHLEDKEYCELARQALKARSADISDLRVAYLRKWSVYGDENFPSTIPID